MIHHAMWTWTRQCYFVLLLIQILNRTDLSPTNYLVVDSNSVVSNTLFPAA